MDIDHEQMQLTVSDDGVGIDLAERDAVFQRFQRGRNATTDGTGVGLSLVQRIARSYGGYAEIGDGDVTTVVVHLLPTCRVRPTDTPTSSAPRFRPPHLDRVRHPR